MYHILFIHSFADGHLGCFHVLAIVHMAVVNIGVCVSVWIMVFSGDGYRVSMLQDIQMFQILLYNNVNIFNSIELYTLEMLRW